MPKYTSSSFINRKLRVEESVSAFNFFWKLNEVNEAGLVTYYDDTLKGKETFEIYIEGTIEK